TGAFAQPPAEEAEPEEADAPEAPEEGAEQSPGAFTPVWAEDEAAEGDAGEAGEGEDAAPEPTEAALPAFPREAAGSAAPAPTADREGGRIPIDFDLHGYYRARAVWTRNVPVPRFGP